MSFLWKWWGSSKKEEEKGETIEKEKKEEVKKEEKDKEEKEKTKNEKNNENIIHKKKSSLSGNEYNLEEDDDNEETKGKIEDNNIKDDEQQNITSQVILQKNEDEPSSINNNLSDKLSNKKSLIDDLRIIKDDSLHWKSVIYGPENTPYAKGKFDIIINFEGDKSNEKPIIKFLTKIYHYNVKQNDGVVLCPNIWNKNSSDEENMKKIKMLMIAPDSRYPCNKFIQQEFYNDYQNYKKKALKLTQDYAMF